MLVAGQPQDYVFRPVQRNDLTMLRQWLEMPHVRRWWGEPEQQAALLEQSLDEPPMTMLIVALRGRQFGYAQHYVGAVWPQPHFELLPPGTHFIDYFIGEPDMLGHGHAGAFLRGLARQVKKNGARFVASDPDADNMRSRGALKRAGFRGDTLVATPKGNVVPMLFDARAPGGGMFGRG